MNECKFVHQVHSIAMFILFNHLKTLPYRKISSMKKKDFLFQLRIELIDHFPMCYGAVQQQFQEEHTTGRENVLVSRTVGDSSRKLPSN